MGIKNTPRNVQSFSYSRIAFGERKAGKRKANNEYAEPDYFLGTALTLYLHTQLNILI